MTRMNDPSNLKTCLAEIIPGLWIGSLASLKALFTLSTEHENTSWTVITVLSSEPLVQSATRILEDEKARHAITQQARGPKNSNHLTIRHEIWSLADQPRSHFVSDRLDQILSIISDSMDENDQKLPLSSSVAKAKQPRLKQQWHTQQRHNCLVHCAQGKSRSAAICAAWLISRRGYTFVNAMDTIRLVRPYASPNLGFLAGLRAIDQCHGDIQNAKLRLQPKPRQLSAQQSSKEEKRCGDGTSRV